MDDGGIYMVVVLKLMRGAARWTMDDLEKGGVALALHSGAEAAVAAMTDAPPAAAAAADDGDDGDPRRLAPVIRQRTWGWYEHHADAVRAVVENHTDLFEANYYDTALIEQYPEGVCSLGRQIQWYKAEYPHRREEEGFLQGTYFGVEPFVVPIDQPPWAKVIVNFALG
jgi:hypothetical protein